MLTTVSGMVGGQLRQASLYLVFWPFTISPYCADISFRFWNESTKDCLVLVVADFICLFSFIIVCVPTYSCLNLQSFFPCFIFVLNDFLTFFIPLFIPWGFPLCLYYVSCCINYCCLYLFPFMTYFLLRCQIYQLVM